MDNVWTVSWWSRSCTLLCKTESSIGSHMPIHELDWKLNNVLSANWLEHVLGAHKSVIGRSYMTVSIKDWATPSDIEIFILEPQYSENCFVGPSSEVCSFNHLDHVLTLLLRLMLMCLLPWLLREFEWILFKMFTHTYKRTRWIPPTVTGVGFILTLLIRLTKETCHQ